MTELTTSRAGGFSLERLLGPLLLKELRVASRRRRTYLLRAGYLASLILFTLALYVEASWDQVDVVSVSKMADVGRQAVTWILGYQFVVLPVVAAVMCSEAFAGEIRRGCLHGLLTSPMGDWQILLGKLLGATGQTLVLLLCSVPLMGIVRSFGGVTVGQLLDGTCAILGTVLLAGSASLYFSSLYPSAVKVTLLTLLFLFGYCATGSIFLLVVLVLMLLVPRRIDPDDERRFFNRTLALLIMPLLGPLAVLPATLLLSIAAEGGILALAAAPTPYTSPALLLFLPAVSLPVPMPGSAAVCLLMQAGFSMLLLRWACLGVQKGRLGLLFVNKTIPTYQPESLNRILWALEGQAAASPPRPLRRPSARPAQRGLAAYVAGKALLWRETRLPLIRSVRFFSWVVSVPLGLLVPAFILSGAISWHDPASYAFWATLWMTIGAGMTAVLAGLSVSSDRQDRTWVDLMTCPAPSREIGWMKSLAIFYRCRHVWLWLLVYLGLAVLIVPVGAPVAVAHAAGLHVFLTGLGLYVGTRVRSTTTAVVIVLATGAMLWAVTPALIGPLSRAPDLREPALAVWKLNPFVQVHQVIASHPTPWAYGDADRRPPSLVGPGDLLLSLALHAGTGLVLGLLACRRFREIV